MHLLFSNMFLFHITCCTLQINRAAFFFFTLPLHLFFPFEGFKSGKRWKLSARRRDLLKVSYYDPSIWTEDFSAIQCFSPFFVNTFLANVTTSILTDSSSESEEGGGLRLSRHERADFKCLANHTVEVLNLQCQERKANIFWEEMPA